MELENVSLIILRGLGGPVILTKTMRYRNEIQIRNESLILSFPQSSAIWTKFKNIKIQYFVTQMCVLYKYSAAAELAENSVNVNVCQPFQIHIFMIWN